MISPEINSLLFSFNIAMEPFIIFYVVLAFAKSKNGRLSRIASLCLLSLSLIAIFLYSTSELGMRDNYLFISNSFAYFLTISLMNYSFSFISIILASVLIIKSRKEINDLSISEAFDNYKEGIYFYTDSDFILENRVFVDVALSIFHVKQVSGQAIDGLLSKESNHHYYCSLKGKTYEIAKRKTLYQGTLYYEVNASDISQEYAIKEKMEEETKLLKDNQAKLKDSIAISQKLAETKQQQILRSEVHNAMGYRINILSKQIDGSIEEHKPFNLKEIIQEIEDDDKTLLSYKLKDLKNDLASIGASLIIKGELPASFVYQNLIYDLIKEASINAIRHGQASQIKVDFTAQAITISNNGSVPPKDFKFGQGLSLLASRFMSIGGILEVTNSSNFCLKVTFNEKD